MKDTTKSFIDKGMGNYVQRQKLPNRSFICGYCGDRVSSDDGYAVREHRDASGAYRGGVYICSGCNFPTFFDMLGDQYPGPIFGSNIKCLPEMISILYDEARKNFGMNNYTSCVMVCRKLLMHIAVYCGAAENLNFIQYVDFLANNGYVPPPHGKAWVKYIRDKGNDANHEIKIMLPEDAKKLLTFIEMLLRLVYEFPNLIDQKKNGEEPGTPK